MNIVLLHENYMSELQWHFVLIGILQTSVRQHGSRQIQVGTEGFRSCEYWKFVFYGQTHCSVVLSLVDTILQIAFSQFLLIANNNVLRLTTLISKV